MNRLHQAGSLPSDITPDFFKLGPDGAASLLGRSMRLYSITRVEKYDINSGTSEGLSGKFALGWSLRTFWRQTFHFQKALRTFHCFSDFWIEIVKMLRLGQSCLRVTSEHILVLPRGKSDSVKSRLH